MKRNKRVTPIHVPKPGSTTVKIVRRRTPRQTPPSSRNTPNHNNNSIIPSYDVTPTHNSAINNNNNALNNNNPHYVTDHSSSFIAVLPQIISSYLQLAINIAIITAIAILLVQFWFVLQHDIDLRAEQYAISINEENKMCAKDYVLNRCDERVPAMEGQCAEWDKCRQRNPTDLARAQISAETIADTINHLIEPISYKTMVFFFSLFTISMLVPNLGLRFGIAKPALPAPPSAPILQHTPQPYFQPILHTPSNSQSSSLSLMDTSSHNNTPLRTPPLPVYDSPYKAYNSGYKRF